MNALVVFVQNKNDDRADDCYDTTRPEGGFYHYYAADPTTGRTPCYGQPDTPVAQSTADDPLSEWPQGRSTTANPALPSWATGMKFLATPGTLPTAFEPGSLSEYYHLNSGGRFTLTGYVYPEVYVPRDSSAWYQRNRAPFENGGVRLSHEIISYVNSHPQEIPLSDPSIFDRYQNGTDRYVSDGIFDMIIVVFRNSDLPGYGVYDVPSAGGISSLGSSGPASYNSFGVRPLTLGGFQVIDNQESGSGVWTVGYSRFLAVTTSAHEIGHRQFGGNHTGDGLADAEAGNNVLSIMFRSTTNRPAMFSASDRLQLGWATVDEINYNSLTSDYPINLTETFYGDKLLIVRNNSTVDPKGDILIESRRYSNVWDQPSSIYSSYQDNDVYAQYIPREGLLVYKLEGLLADGQNTRWWAFARTVENTGLPSRVGDRFVLGSRYLYSPGDAFTPLTRMRFSFPEDPTLDRGFALTDITRSGSGFSFSLRRDFLTAPGVKNLGTNYMFGNHPPISLLSPGLLGTPYAMDGNVARTDDVVLGGTVRLTDGLRQVLAGSPTITLLPGAVLEVPAGTVALLTARPSTSQPFDMYVVTAGAGARIEVVGRLVADHASFEAADVDGWGGLRFGPASGAGKTDVQPPLPSSLTGVSISGVQYQPLERSPYPPHAAVEVQNRTVVIDGGTTITGGVYANGILATGPKADVTVSGFTTRIESNEGIGVLATAGANVLVTDRTALSANELGGVRAVGYGTRATVTGYASVDRNFGVGLLAEAQAHAAIRSPSGTGNTSVSRNVGGPTARSGGSVDGGQCVATGATGRANSFLLNNSNGANLWDASARGGSTIVGRYAFWGTGRTAASLLLDADGSSSILVGPTAAGLGTPDPACPAVIESRAASAAGMLTEQTTQGSVPEERTDDWAVQNAAVAGRGGMPSAAVVALATSAREAAWAGDTNGAFATLAAAADAAVTADDRAAVFEATAALLAEVQPAAVVAALAADAAGAGPDAAWAARTLAVAYAESGQTARAETVAASLAAAPTGDGHAAFGHALLVRLAVESDSAAYALDRLASFEAAVTGSDTLAVEAFESALALVAASFPDADLTAMTGSVAGRGVAGRGTSGGAPASSSPVPLAGAVVDGLSVWPNPASSRGTARLSVSTPARSAVVAVYDALGRRVSVLYDGPLMAGPHDLDVGATALATGTYIVVARVTAEDGRVWTEARRMTVTR